MRARGKPPVVHCCVCGHRHSTASPAVLYRSADGQWWCADEDACHGRYTGLIEAMQRALDEVWEELAANGWRWPA